MLERLRSRYPVYMKVRRQENSSTLTFGTAIGAGPEKKENFVCYEFCRSWEVTSTSFFFIEMYIVLAFFELLKRHFYEQLPAAASQKFQ